MRNYNAYVEEVAHRGSTRMSQATTSSDGINIGAWVNAQRTMYRKGQLPQDRITLMEAIPGWSWEPMESQWMQGFVEFENFYKLSGKLPSTGDKKMYHWMERQKKRQKMGKLDPKFKARIEAAFPEWQWSR